MARPLGRPPVGFLIAIGLVFAVALPEPSAFAQSAAAPLAVPRAQNKRAPERTPPERRDVRDPRGAGDRQREAADTRSHSQVPISPRHQAGDSRSTPQQRKELDDLRREDVASQLALLGIPLKWQDHTLPELTDWRDRIEAAVTLRVQYRVDVDWRVTSLRDLIDMRLRAAKASELSSLHGVRVDWRRYSWVALEAMRRQMTRTPSNNSAAAFAADALATPGSVGRARRPGVRPRDPDAIIEPTFAFDTPLIWSRPFGRGGKPDPDAILIPRFVTVPSSPNSRD